MKKIINQAVIVRYRAIVSEKFFPDFWNRTISAESILRHDPKSDANPNSWSPPSNGYPPHSCHHDDEDEWLNIKPRLTAIRPVDI